MMPEEEKIENRAEAPAESNTTSSAEEKKPVRLKWGRPIADPEEEVRKASAEIEEENRRREAAEAAERAEFEKRMREAERKKQILLARQMADEEAERRRAEAARQEREALLARKREAEAIAAQEAEAARLRAEQEAQKLRRVEQKKRRRMRRRAAVLGFFASLFGAILSVRIPRKHLITLAVTLVVAILFAVLLGNFLLARVSTEDPSEDDSAVTTTPPETVPYGRDMAVPEISAGIVSLEGTTLSDLKTAASRFAATGTKAVSLILRDGEGKLLFRSETENGLFEGGESRLTLSEIFAPFQNRGMYVTCCFPIRYHLDGDEYTRDVLYAYETALLCEIAAAGADEVILLDAEGLFFLNEPNASAYAVERLSASARTVHLRAPKCLVGLALSPAFLGTSDSDRYLSTLATAFDLTLLDLREIESEADSAYEEIYHALTEHMYFILRYSMRVLIPAGNAQAVLDHDIPCWQEGTLPRIDGGEAGTTE